MKKLNLFLAMMIALSSVEAKAVWFSNSVDALEIADVMAHCPAEVAKLLNSGEYVTSVKGKFKQVSDSVATKTYTILSQWGGGMVPVRPGAKLTIRLEVTQPDTRIADGKAHSVYSCNILRAR